MSQHEPKRPPLDFELIKTHATGRYVDTIFPAVGIKLKANPKEHQPCPLCGGKDRFRCDDKGGQGTYICGQCGAGSGFHLVQKYCNLDNYETNAKIADVLGLDAVVGRTFTPAEKQAWAEKQRQAQIEREKAQAEQEHAERQAKIQAQQATATTAQNRFNSATPCTTHPYLDKKGVESFGLRTDTQGILLIPLYFHNPNTNIITLCNLQTIDTDGNKRFLKNGLVKGAFFTIGAIPLGTGTILICEGYATGASLYQATNGQMPVIVAFNAGNMIDIAPAIRTLYPNHRLIFCGDNDTATAQKTGKNTGLLSAQESANATNGEWIVPNFGDDERALSGDLSDFNDLHLAFGIQSVQVQISHALNRQAPPNEGDGYTLDRVLANFAHIKSIGKMTNKIYDLNAKEDMLKTFFEQKVGKALAKEWYNHPKKKEIAIQQVRADRSKLVAETYKDMFEQYCYIQGTKEVFNFKTGKRQSIDTLRLEYPNEFDEWLKSDQRKKVEADNLFFDPTYTKKPLYGETCINTFTGLPLTPLSDDEILALMGDSQLSKSDWLRQFVSPIIELVRHLCGDDNGDEVVEFVLNWLALPLQNLGTKLDTALIFHGHIQGAGKSLFFDRIMRTIYGNYALTLGQGQLESQYNDWVEGKLFTVFEEIVQGKERYSKMGMIKQLITGDTVYINKKFMSGWKQDNFTNVVFLSNDIQPLSLETGDRRHIVLYPKHILPNDLKAEISHALNDDKHLLVRAWYTFLKSKNVGNQDAHTIAIQTSAKTRLQQLSMPSWERFYLAWKSNTLEVNYQTCLSADLYEYYVYWCRKNGEKATSSTKFLTFVGLHEDKRVVRYLVWRQISNGDTKADTKQGTVINVYFGEGVPDAHSFGLGVKRFKEQFGEIKRHELPPYPNEQKAYQKDNYNH